jgi:hypothetical protein
MFLPILSVLNTSYLTYLHINEFKEDKQTTTDEKVKKYVPLILIAIGILVLSIFVELKMGRLFQLLIIALGLVLINPKELKFQDILFYFMAVAAVVGIYCYKNNYIRCGLVGLITIIIITMEILEYKNKKTEKGDKFKDNLKLFLEALLMTSLILIWSEYGKKPKYIKLFIRK